jgi:hypothetical protein
LCWTDPCDRGERTKSTNPGPRWDISPAISAAAMLLCFTTTYFQKAIDVEWLSLTPTFRRATPPRQPPQPLRGRLRRNQLLLPRLPSARRAPKHIFWKGRRQVSLPHQGALRLLDSRLCRCAGDRAGTSSCRCASRRRWPRRRTRPRTSVLSIHTQKKGEDL